MPSRRSPASPLRRSASPGGDRSSVTGGTQGALRPRRLQHQQARRDLHRPDDRARRGCLAAEDPQRDRANILLASLTIISCSPWPTAASARDFIRRTAVDHRARLAARVPVPDDDWRAALRHRHRRHGPPRCSATCWRCPAGRSRWPAPPTRCCSTRPARSPSATARPASSSRRATCRSRSSPTPRSCPPSPTRRRRAARSSCSRRKRYGLREARGGRSSVTATFVPFTVQTRMSGVGPPTTAARSARGRRAPSWRGCASTAARCRSRPASCVDGISRVGRHPARGRRPRSRPGARARRHPPQGRRQGRHALAVRRAAPDGHPHGDDHRRQPADRARRSPTRQGVDDFLAEATPEDKMALIRARQEGGKLVAMTGDGTNDAPLSRRPTSASR